MIKIFISQPMNGKTNEEILKAREDITARLSAQFARCNTYIEIIDSFFKDAPHDAKPLWYLGESIKLMSSSVTVGKPLEVVRLSMIALLNMALILCMRRI